MIEGTVRKWTIRLDKPNSVSGYRSLSRYHELLNAASMMLQKQNKRLSNEEAMIKAGKVLNKAGIDISIH